MTRSKRLWFSGSESQRALTCLPSGLLPRYSEAELEERKSEASRDRQRLGNEIHDHSHHYCTTGERKPASKRAKAWEAALHNYGTAAEIRGRYSEFEVTYGWNLEEQKPIEPAKYKSRDEYPDYPFWHILATADMANPAVKRVGDLKTGGRTISTPADAEDYFFQLAVISLCAFDKGSEVFNEIYKLYCRKPPAVFEQVTDTTEVFEFVQASFEEWLKLQPFDKEVNYDITPGSYCYFCPAHCSESGSAKYFQHGRRKRRNK